RDAGRAELQQARDVARHSIAASRARVRGALVLDPPGQAVAMSDVIDAIHAAAPESAASGGLDGGVSLGGPEKGATGPSVALLGDLPTVSLRDGVKETIESFRG